MKSVFDVIRLFDIRKKMHKSLEEDVQTTLVNVENKSKQW